MVGAVDSYDVFDAGAKKTVTPGNGKDTQDGNPMKQQQQQPARQEAEGRGSKNLMIREQTRTYNAEGGRGQGGAREKQEGGVAEKVPGNGRAQRSRNNVTRSDVGVRTNP